MITVLKRELKGIFTSHRGYAFVAAFAVVFCALRMVYHNFFLSFSTFVLYDAAYGTAYSLMTFEYILTYLPAAAALALPFITCGILRRERKDGAAALLRALPFTAKGVFLGKYLAVLSVLLIVFGATSVISWLLGFYTGRDVLTVAVSMLSFVLVCNTLLSIDMLISALCKKTAVCYAVSFAVNGALVALAATRYEVPRILGEIFGSVSVIASYELFLVGVLDVSAIVLNITLSAVCTYVAYAVMKRDLKL